MKLEMPLIETERCYLRAVELEDICDLYELYQDERVMWKTSIIKPIKSMDEMEHSLKIHYLSYRQKGVPQSMAIEWKENGTVIGVIDFHSMKKDMGEIGYMLHYDYWNRGIMKEVLKEMVRLGFQYLGLHRIEAMYAPDNAASAHVLHACGFQDEGILRSYMKLNDGVYHDLVLSSIIKEEYEIKQQEVMYE